MKKTLLKRETIHVQLINNKLHVKNNYLKTNPALNVPINIKIQSGFIPEVRASINEWFKKHF